MKRKKLIKEIGEKQFEFFEKYFDYPAVYGAITSVIDLYSLINIERNDISIISFKKALKLYMQWRKFNYTFSLMRKFQPNGLPIVQVTGFLVNAV